MGGAALQRCILIPNGISALATEVLAGYFGNFVGPQPAYTTCSLPQR